MTASPPRRSLLKSLAIGAVRYYAALRLSAGAATALLPDEPLPDLAPIVRSARQSRVAGFDVRELIVRQNSVFVVTLDESSATRPSRSHVFRN